MSTPDRQDPPLPLPPPSPDKADLDRKVADDEHGTDPETSREGLELELMDEDASDVGEHIGDHNP